ncbi:MAG TPA: PEP-CTERM sorting domain-containing protein [Chthoniobacterales bacterium]|jgi:hypothetical protein
MKTLFLANLFILALGAAATADVVARYDFSASSAASSDPDANSTASAITVGAGFSSLTFSTTWGNPAPSLSIVSSETDSPNTQGGAVTANDYITFTITPNVGTLSFSSLTVDLANFTTDGTFPTENFFLRSSRNSFASNIGGAVQVAASSNGAFTNAVFELSGVAFQNIAVPVEFRLYVFDNTTNAARGALIDNITVNTVPEPSTYAMLFGGAGLVFVVMRRKRLARA